jgi:hypothetical protein
MKSNQSLKLRYHTGDVSIITFIIVLKDWKDKPFRNLWEQEKPQWASTGKSMSEHRQKSDSQTVVHCMGIYHHL